MNELTDFEALIDLNEIFTKAEEENEDINKEGSQEPLSDVLDKMCETIDAESITIGLNAVNSDEKHNDNVALDDTIVNLNEFNKILNETRVLNENINNLDNEESILSNGDAKIKQNENNAVPYHSPVADLDDIADIVKDTAGESNDKRENENDSEKADDKIINLDEFDEIFIDTRVPNVITDNLENKETTLSCEAKNMVKYFSSGTDLVEIANFSTSEGCHNKAACKIDTEEAKNKVDLDDTVINLDKFEDVVNGTCAFKETLFSIKLAEFEENEGMAPLVKIENQTKNDTCEKIFNADFPVPPLTTSLEGKENLSAFKTFDSHNSNKDDKYELKTIHIEKDIEVISISSTEDLTALDDSNNDDGYNSDDFEFISESEAKKQGPLTNLDVKQFKDEPLYSDMKYHKNNYTRCTISSTEANRATHVVPEGQSYLNLFRGICAPIVMNNLFNMTNKHVLPAQSMSITDGFGFDIPEQREENPEHVAEAAESLKKIYFLYPGENRKRRRRF